MITTSEHDIYAAENRVDCARLAFDTAAHYRRLSRLDELDEYTRGFALKNIGFYNLLGTLLLTECTDTQIDDACTRLLEKVER